MSETAQRVVLLARPGEACERMQASLRDSAVAVVLTADPAQIDAAGVQAANPTALVVLLEPAVEESLEKLQAIFDDPGIIVIYDEAELTVSRQGWDAARWMRHLIAKLERHDDVLPPRLDKPAARADGASPASDTLVFAGEYDIAANEPTIPMPQAQDGMAAAMRFVQEQESRGDGTAQSQKDTWEALEFSASDPAQGNDADDGNALRFDLSDEFAEADLQGIADTQDAHDEAPTRISSLSLDDDMGELAWQPREDLVDADAPQGLDDLMQRLEQDRAAPAPPAAAPAPPADAPQRAAFDLSGSGLELAGFDAPPQAPAASSGASAQPARDWSNLDALDQRIAHLQLVDDAAPAGSAAATTGVAGAVWVYAGIGGPDAIRHLLAALPADFQRPVVVQQQLDGARHDKFVQQLQRVSNLPVELAVAGEQAQASRVYVLPQGLELRAADAWRFAECEAARLPDLSQVDAQRSAVIMLSGGDPAVAANAAALSQQGALLLAQSPDGCFDAAAPKALIAQGAQADAPAGIAARLQRY